MPDRTQAPSLNEIAKIQILKYESLQLDNGIPVKVVNKGTQEVIKLEIVFRAGRPYEKQKLVSRATSSLIKEGSGTLSSSQIAEKIDFYGGTLSTPFNLDTSSVVLYCLKKHFAELLPLVAEILLNPSFPQEELNTFVQNSKYQLQVDLSKTDVVAYRAITEYIFGSKHPYGYNSQPEDYDALTQKDLFEHYNLNYNSNNCDIFISGKISAEELSLLNKYLGSGMNDAPAPVPTLIASNSPPEKVKITHEKSVQTAIRIGLKMFNKQHPDYPAMFVLNTILGGYFGSRLMANIREDKGYTYNIFSAFDTMHFGGCLYIGTEVGNKFVEPTLAEIYREIDRLRTQPVGEEELTMVRNYLLGNMLAMLDGPFNIGDVVKTMTMENLTEDTFPQLVNTIKTISARDIQGLAGQYLNPKDMWEVIVGV